MDLVGKYLISMGVFLSIDLVWLGLVAKNFYAGQIGQLMAKDVTWTAALLFYLIYVAGLMYLVMLPNETAGYRELFIKGAVVGLMAYGAYDLTNLAVLKDWPVVVTVVDIVWGMVLTGTVAVASVWLWKALAVSG